MSSLIRVTGLTVLGNSSVHAFLYQVIRPPYIILLKKFS